MAHPNPNPSPAEVPGGSSNLGEILVEVGVITPEQLRQVQQAARGSEQDLGKWLVDLGFTTEEKIMKGIGIKAKVPYFTSLEGLYSAESANIISEELARRLRVVPLFKIDQVATVAMVNPLDVFTIDTLVKTTGLRIDPVVCMRTTIFETINKLYSGYEAAQPADLQIRPHAPSNALRKIDSPIVIEPSLSVTGRGSLETAQERQERAGEASLKDLLNEIKSKMPEQKIAQVDVYRKNIEKSSEEMPIVQLVDAIFKQAVTQKASDIHIEPYEDHTEVRFRIDGVLHPVMTVPKELEAALVARIKVMANLDITETRQPQDGRVVTEVERRPMDLRISTLSIIHGEKTVIRVLDKGVAEFNLRSLGFTEATEKLFKATLHRPNGIMLVTGPTGSGKSTTLYCGLKILNSTERNIVTLEDPVEFQLPGINQVQVNTKVGLTFAKGLRSILRQDPNVVMVGEIRDEETAQIAIQAALTGHLVLSTLHTNDAPTAITRLINMGVEPFLISASVLMVIAQRLLRMLCPGCKVAYQPAAAVVEKLQKINGGALSGAAFYKTAGCRKCHDTGYLGRKAIYEILCMTPALRELTVSNGTLDGLRDQAKKDGMRTLLEEGVAAVASGLTTLEEMMRVCTIEQ